MGRIPCTRDGEDLYDHEGYVSPVLDDGSSTHGTLTIEIVRRTVAWRAECPCGWSGTNHESGGPTIPSDRDYDAVLEDWELSHAAPLLRNVERKRQLELLAEIRRTAETLLRDGIEEALARGATWNDIAVAIRTDVDDAERLRGSPVASDSVQGRTSLSLTGLCDGPIAPIGEGSRSRTGR